MDFGWIWGRSVGRAPRPRDAAVAPRRPPPPGTRAGIEDLERAVEVAGRLPVPSAELHLAERELELQRRAVEGGARPAPHPRESARPQPPVVGRLRGKLGRDWARAPVGIWPRLPG